MSEEYEYEVWTEGYSGSGDQGQATFHGIFKGRTFAEACESWAKTTGAPDLFDRDSMTYWRCRLFADEDDARESFG